MNDSKRSSSWAAVETASILAVVGFCAFWAIVAVVFVIAVIVQVPQLLWFIPLFGIPAALLIGTGSITGQMRSERSRLNLLRLLNFNVFLIGFVMEDLAQMEDGTSGLTDNSSPFH